MTKLSDPFFWILDRIFQSEVVSFTLGCSDSALHRFLAIHAEVNFRVSKFTPSCVIELGVDKPD